MKTGNTKQVANFEKLVSTATAYGAGYNPAKGSMKLQALNALLTQARQSLQNVSSAETKYTIAVSARETAFGTYDKMITRIVNAFASSDASQELIEDAMMIKRKVTYSRNAKSMAKVNHSSDHTGAAVSMDDPPVSASRGNRDFDNRVALLYKLIELVSAEPSYKPNEADLKVVSLTAYANSLRDANTAVMTAISVMQLARASRNAVLYKDGIYKTASQVKRYVKSVYGAKSEQFNSIGGLVFIGK